MVSKDDPIMVCDDDALIDHLCMPTEWTHPLPFMMIREEEIRKDNEPEPELLDIMSISDITYKGTYRYYFPRKYKPSDPCGHQLLTNDLRGVGLSQGVKFARTGGGPSMGVYPLLCKCATYYRPNAPAAVGVTSTEDVAGFSYKTGIKGQSLVNQRKNCRPHSATKNPMPKKCRTNRPQKGFGSTCKARLTFYADHEHDRFSIKAYNGNRYHSDHHQVKSSEIPIGVKDLGVKTVQLVQAMHEAELNRSSVRNLVYQQSGVALNGDTIAYLKRMLSDPNTSKAAGVSNKVNNLINVLGKEEGVKFCLLFHDAPEHIDAKVPLIVRKGIPKSGKHKKGKGRIRGTICCETYDGANQTKDGLEGIQSTAATVDRDDSAHEAAELIRLEHKIGSKGRLLLAVAWATADGVSNFAKFPETLGADTTFGTNEERRPLIQLVGKDSLGRTFTACQGFLPHEKRFIFDWLFQEAIPALLGRENCGKTRVILTDGDQTEIAAVDMACQLASDIAMDNRALKIKLHQAIALAISPGGQTGNNERAAFWNAMHRTCFYHLWTQKLPSLRGNAVPSIEANACWNTLDRWINSLSNALETWAEFQLSRRLLESWLASKRVKEHLGLAVVHTTLEFLARSVFPHETRFAAYVFQRVPTFDERTTSPNEGENRVIKAKGTGVKPNSSLADSTRNILYNHKVRAENKHVVSISEWTSSPTWSNTPWSKKLTTKGEGLLRHRLKGSSKYDHVRVTIRLWYVKASPSGYPPLDTHGPVPRPIRTRTVEIKEHLGKEYILCDCYQYDRSKMACEHVIHVLLSLGVDLTTYHLAGIRWTTNYNIKYGSADISDTLRDAFERCLQHPGVPFHPSTWVDDWLGLPTYSSSCLTMNHFCPRSLGRPPILHNYPGWSTVYLHHQQSAALGANVSQLVVTTPSFTSPVIGKADPVQLPTSESLGTTLLGTTLESTHSPPPPVSSFQDRRIGNCRCQQESYSPAIGMPDPFLPLVTPESAVNTFSLDDPQAKKRPAYFHVKDELTDICRLSEGHEHAEEFASCALLLIRGALSGSHSCPTKRAQMEEFSRLTRAMFSNGQPPSHEEALSQLKRVLLPEDQELHSFNASVENESVYKRKRRFNEKHYSS
jgi:hypothetical protein